MQKVVNIFATAMGKNKRRRPANAIRMQQKGSNHGAE